jgi:hypothetical protein
MRFLVPVPVSLVIVLAPFCFTWRLAAGALRLARKVTLPRGGR